MEVRLLGLVELVDGDGTATRLGAGEAALLAFLALHPGRVVPAERLLDALWGEDLPRNPANALQLRVSKLRKALTAAGSDAATLVTRSPGYVLDLPPDAIDVRRITDRFAQARSLARAGETAAAVEVFRAAFAAWRAPPLMELRDATWAATEARHLEELRLSATEEWLELELSCGHHDAVLREVDAQLPEYPLRERLHALRMRALYRSGRQADALAAFQSARDLLAEEMGLDPSPELCDLERAILRQDPRLDGPPAACRGDAGDLPAPVGSVVGRAAEIQEVTELLGAHRLVTVTGPGGTGKTTLATEAARRVRGAFADGVVLVLLQSVAAGEDITATIAAACDLVSADALQGPAADERLARQLGQRRTLLVLDNCEHVVEQAAATVQQLLTRCPHLVVLATSREALGVHGEVRYALGPLAVPETDQPPGSVRATPAIELFIRRGRESDRSFDPADGELATIAAVCRRLDGMPLAIELAAATVRSLPLPELLCRLDDRFGLLSSGPRTADARHRTLRATVAWSHNLLTADERIGFRRLSVFRGSWTLADAEVVCGGPPLSPTEVLGVVSRLVDQSLVTSVDADGRFRMLETIRCFAEEQLHSAGEHEATMTRLALSLVTVAEEADRQVRGPDQVAWLRRLEHRRDDIRAALTYSRDHPDRLGATGLRLAAGLGWHWHLSNPGEGRQLLRQLLDGPSRTDPATRGRALQAFAVVARPSACIVHPSEVCASAAAASVPLLEAAGDDLAAARSRILLAVEGVRGGPADAALDTLRTGLAVLPPDGWDAALGAFVEMEILVRHGRSEEGIARGDVAVGSFARLGDLWGVSAVRAHQGFNLRAIGRLDDAAAAYEESLAVARGAGLHRGVQVVAGEIALTSLARGRTEAAMTALAEGEAAARRFGHLDGIGFAHLVRGFLARASGAIEDADTEFARGIEILDDVASLPYLGWAHSGRGHVRELLGDLAGAEACHRRVLETAQALSDVWLTALGLEGLAGVAVREEPVRAAQLLGEAQRIRCAGMRPPSPLETLDLDRVVVMAKEALGPEAFRVAAAGGLLDLEVAGSLAAAAHRAPA